VTKRAIAAAFVVLAGAAIISFIAPTGFWKRAGTANAADPAAARVDTLFAEWDRPDSPGCSVGVSRDGLPVHERGYGMANLELGVPITPASVFHVASVSKQFTAMSILLLARQGKLSLDDEVRTHVPEWADRESRVTIRHLLTHTGGLRDVFLLTELAAPRRDGGNLNDALVSLLARQRGLNFAPGSEFQYSNSGYVVLANIVKRVSGQSLRAFAGANIFTPLGMAHTHVHDDPKTIVPNRASGYHRDAAGLQVAPHADQGRLVGTTGVFTTTQDVLRWQQNLADVRVGDPALLAAMQTSTVLTGGGTSPYGFGLEIGEHGALRTISHGGGDPGYAAYVIRYPDRGLAVAVLCNLDNIGFGIGELARRVAEVYLPDLAAAPPSRSATANPAAFSLSPSSL
jgi:CubicO group peptidase (beta-lactamase class C family)